MEELYYLQDSRSYVGNDMIWWCVDGRGYTTDLSKAHIYTKGEAIEHHESRYSDIPWPKEYIDKRTRPAVDMQYCERDLALKGTGIKIVKPKIYRQKYKCALCGKFITEEEYHTNSGPCDNCPDGI